MIFPLVLLPLKGYLYEQLHPHPRFAALYNQRSETSLCKLWDCRALGHTATREGTLATQRSQLLST